LKLTQPTSVLIFCMSQFKIATDLKLELVLNLSLPHDNF